MTITERVQLTALSVSYSETDKLAHKSAVVSDCTLVCTLSRSVIFVTSCGINTITTVVIVHHQSPTNEPPTANGSTSILALAAGQVECCVIKMSCGGTSGFCWRYCSWNGSVTVRSGWQLEGLGHRLILVGRGCVRVELYRR